MFAGMPTLMPQLPVKPTKTPVFSVIIRIFLYLGTMEKPHVKTEEVIWLQWKI